MAKRQVPVIKRAVAYARRSDYLTACTMTSTDLLAGVREFGDNTTVTGPEHMATLRMLTRLAIRRGAWGLAHEARTLQGRR